MTAKDAIREIMADVGYSQSKLAAECGMKGQTNITGILNRGSSLRVDVLEQLVNAMGYEVVIRKKGEEGGGIVVHEGRSDGEEAKLSEPD